ncbi:hypothetical protein AKJ64_02195 [candidate division MSBL1 archaeon SCGC-AAA259E17]|uniref:Uncharacterized protein n=1 Tax=candidate division MSBL1 archaeon SCGC-AAA259E17 TaxID=1698263 RepID=A0A133UF19_9EURY|nr:hypothetical protein AKJ64_02195 [candidate division MSBL1 archaeon SCGC-AAA259E17]
MIPLLTLLSADIVWIGSMGDLAFQSTENMEKVIGEMIEPNPETLFFLETKNPATYNRFIDDLPENVIVSTTIETNRPCDVTDASAPLKRFLDFMLCLTILGGDRSFCLMPLGF